MRRPHSEFSAELAAPDVGSFVNLTPNDVHRAMVILKCAMLRLKRLKLIGIHQNSYEKEIFTCSTVQEYDILRVGHWQILFYATG